MSAETRVRYKIPGSVTSPYLEAALEHSMKKTDLSEEALVQAIKNIKAHQMLTGEEVAERASMSLINHQIYEWTLPSGAVASTTSKEFAEWIEALRDELASVKQDAERYRFIRDDERCKAVWVLLDSSRAEAAIDAAIEEEKHE